MSIVADNAAMHNAMRYAQKPEEPKGRVVVNSATMDKLTKEDKRDIEKRFNEIITSVVNDKFGYLESEKPDVIASLEGAFKELLERGWSGTGYNKSFEYALYKLGEEGVAITFKEFNLSTKHKSDNKTNKMLKKAGFRDSHYFLVDEGEFTKQVAAKVYELESEGIENVVGSLTRLFNTNKMGNFREVLDLLRTST